jgi:hypothetical protein
LPAKGFKNPDIRDDDGNVIPWKKRNKDRSNALARLRRALNPEREKATRRRAFLKHKFGLTPELREALILAQDCRCAICKIELPIGSPKWATDHCHRGKYVRGMLCKSCNSAIGLLRDDPTIVRKAAEYLESALTIVQEPSIEDLQIAAAQLEKSCQQLKMSACTGH